MEEGLRRVVGSREVLAHDCPTRKQPCSTHMGRWGQKNESKSRITPAGEARDGGAGLLGWPAAAGLARARRGAPLIGRRRDGGIQGGQILVERPARLGRP